ncbi:MFS transporter [Aromatoleum petrolei]|uniref:MFS transporter n=1 Tax=Aromatoleum petrolei TaxID=76116 RepID=A0ABX1MHV0_9RHOO|nr:MFS transporter [Aromatoleum petrolei]NMF87518.1 MFS transporter [Aromatoleum petrolei]QTQ38614.1 Major facilitator superfamily (MFS) protein [Aromatoleum petrolei]
MEKALAAETPLPAAPAADALSVTTYPVIAAISFSHLLNDMMQSVLLAIYPMLKLGLDLSFAQVGLITLAYQLTASLLQPLIGLYTDRRPMPYSLPVGMGFTLFGLLSLSQAGSFGAVLTSAMLIGMGSSIFHPESSRVARMAAGSQPGLAQSLFQIGGNLGSAIGPLLAAVIIVPQGQGSAAWFSLFALVGVVVLSFVGRWSHHHVTSFRKRMSAHAGNGLSRRQVAGSLAILGLLMFSKFFYMTSLSSYYTFYLMDKFGLALGTAQIYLFAFLFAVACGTVLGGPIGDRIGRKRVIWISILGVAPFTLLLPHVGLFWTAVLSVVIGLILASAFSAILVYAQELVPGKVGTISGLFFGLAFGMGGIGAALLGQLADATSIGTVYQFCAYLPLIGLLTAFLPAIRKG